MDRSGIFIRALILYDADNQENVLKIFRFIIRWRVWSRGAHMELHLKLISDVRTILHTGM